jgi:uncharacterized membrane protein required for colicin V production
MGLDLALGVIILIAAFRGWLQGFVSQALRIAGLIACVYLAEPVRNYAKPYVFPYLPTIQPELVDRLLWWVSAVTTYVVLVGFSTLIIKMTRRPEIPGIRESGRNDQFAGFLLGAAKGLLAVAFLTAGVQKYASNHLSVMPWAEEQVKSSWAFKCNEQYQPVARIWSSSPVRHYVNHIQRMGLQNPAEPSQISAGEEATDSPTVKTASRSPRLEVRGPDRNETESDRSSSSSSSSSSHAQPLDEEVERAVEEIKSELRARSKPSD